MVVDLVIVGSGYWGAAVYLFAKQRGLSVKVVDDGDLKSGSRNASGIADIRAYRSSVFRKYWPSDWADSELVESFDWLCKIGGRITQETFWNQYQNRSPRKGTECVYVATPATLTSQIQEGDIVSSRVEQIRPGKQTSLVQLQNGKTLETRHVVIAAGYQTDSLLIASGLRVIGVTGLYGRGIIARSKSLRPELPLPISVMIRPYCKHTVRSWPGGRYKIGDTAEEKPNDNKLEALRTVGRLVLGNFQEQTIQEGYRPVADKFLVAEVCPRVIVATGGHRLGLGLAGLVGKKVLEIIR